jgi:hypothetical protein
MAFLFLLTVNFSDDSQSAKEFCDYIKKKGRTIIFSGEEVRLDNASVINYPHIAEMANNYEVIVSVCDIRDELANKDLSDIGKELYTLLKGGLKGSRVKGVRAR